MAEYGLKESGLIKLISASYSILNLITFFTAGPKEVRAWTIHKGWRAPQAAGVIHSDFEKGFIKAEVIKLNDYLKYKTELACREAGKIGIQGKEYVVHDARCRGAGDCDCGAGPVIAKIKEALKEGTDPEPEPELWGCCGAERKEIHVVCPRCS